MWGYFPYCLTFYWRLSTSDMNNFKSILSVLWLQCQSVSLVFYPKWYYQAWLRCCWLSPHHRSQWDWIWRVSKRLDGIKFFSFFILDTTCNDTFSKDNLIKSAMDPTSSWSRLKMLNWQGISCLPTDFLSYQLQLKLSALKQFPQLTRLAPEVE